MPTKQKTHDDLVEEAAEARSLGVRPVSRSITVWSPTNKEMIVEEDALDCPQYDPEADPQEAAVALATALGLRVTIVDQEIGYADPRNKD